MKRNIQSMFAQLSACLLIILTTACSTDTDNERIMPDEEDFCFFQLSTFMPQTVETRAMNESSINDLWVIQLNASGTEALVPPVYLTSSELTSQSNEVEFKVKLKKENSTVYVIANSGDDSLFDKDAALNTFKKSVIEGKSITSNINWKETLDNRTYIPMSATWNGTPNPATPIKADLIRAIAYLSISVKNEIPSGSSLSITSIQLKNVPQTLYYVTPSASIFPDAGTAFMDYLSPSSTNLTYYMPDNCRGTGSGRYETEKTAAAVSNGNKATYVEIKGTYNGIGITYCFYLGGNITNDYNVKRNTQYTVNITLSGSYRLDARVTLDASPMTISSGSSVNWEVGGNTTLTGSRN